MFCRGNPRGCPIVGRFSKINRAVSRYEYTPTQAQEIDDYPLEQMEDLRFLQMTCFCAVVGGLVVNTDRCSLQLLQNVNTP